MSRALRTLGLIGAGMSGLAKGEMMYEDMQDRRDDRAARREEREARREERARMAELRKQEDADRAALRQAAVVDPVVESQTYQPAVDDEGNPMPANPAPVRFQTGGKTFDTRDAATSAAEDAASRRVVATMRSINPMQAEQLRSTQLQQLAAQLQLDAAQRKQLDAAFDRELLEAIPRGPDGQPDAKALEAAYLRSRSATPAEKLAFLVQTEQRRRAEEKDERDYTLRKDLTDAQIRHLNAQANAVSHKANNVFDRMDEADKVKFQSLQKQIESISDAIVKAQAQGMWQADTPSSKALQSQLAALRVEANTVLKKYEGNRKEGDTPDPLNLRGGQDGAPRGTSPTQQQLDVEGGKQIIRSELGGDLERARAAVARLQAEAQQGGELGMIARRQAAIIQAGIDALAKPAQSPAAPKVAPPIVPAPRVSMTSAVPAIEQLDTPTLARIAATQGHANQARAIAILRQRQAEAAQMAPAADTAAAALGFGA